MTHQKRPNNKGKSPSKDKEVHRPNAPKDHLEVPSGEENSFEKRKQELQDETQQFHPFHDGFIAENLCYSRLFKLF